MALQANSASPLAPISMTWPKPPRVRPAPPLSGRSSLRQNTTGATFSVASTGMVRTPDGKAVPSSPSCVGRAPVPPELKVMTSKSTSGESWPLTIGPPRNGGFHRHDDPSAVTRFGTAWCRQPIIRSGNSWPSTWRTATAAGRGAFRMQPAGMCMWNGARLAVLLGMPGATTHLMPKLA